MSNKIDELEAAKLFKTAIDAQRAAELLQALFDGGSATVSPDGELIIVDVDTLRGFLAGDPDG